MEFIKQKEVPILSSIGVESFQLLSQHNSDSESVAITKVYVQPGNCQAKHKHDQSEQIWVALAGVAKLLLSEDSLMEFKVGDIVRFESGEIHGLLNDSDQECQY